jgi:glyceraldehyde 3-phosphate dehydrogenase
MRVKVGVNGFGGSGQLVFQTMMQRPEEFDVIAVNDLTDPNQLVTDPIRSSGTLDNPHSCSFDGKSTSVLSEGKGTMVNVFGLCDNEWGYSCRIADLVARIENVD